VSEPADDELTGCLDDVAALYDAVASACDKMKGKAKKACSLRARGDKYSGTADCLQIAQEP